MEYLHLATVIRPKKTSRMININWIPYKLKTDGFYLGNLGKEGMEGRESGEE